MPESKTILILDDDELLLEALTVLLSDPALGGYHVMAACDGRAGLVLARTRRPDLILTDLEMPVMDGETFVQQLRAELGAAMPPVLVFSGRDDVYAIATRLGVSVAMRKPFELDRFLELITTLLYRDDTSEVAECPGTAPSRNLAGV